MPQSAFLRCSLPSRLSFILLVLAFGSVFARADSVSATISVSANPARIAANATIPGNVFVAHVGSCPPSFGPCISVINGTSVTQVKSLPSTPAGLAVTPDGTELWVCLPNQKRVIVYDLPSLNLHTFSGGGSNPIQVGPTPVGIAFDHNGKAFVTNSVGAGTVQAIQVSTGTNVNTFSVGSQPVGVVVASNTVFVANEGSNTVSYFSANGGAVGTINVGGAPFSVASSSSGSRVYVTNSGQNGAGGMSIIDVASKTVISSPATGNTPIGVTVLSSAGVDYVYVSNAPDSTVNKYDASGNLLQTLFVGTWPVGLAASGTSVYVPNEFSNSVSVISFF